jgi:hypothetical protein
MKTYYKFAVLPVLASVLILSAYQHAQGVFLCIIDSACKTQCNYCMSARPDDPNCESYESYTSLLNCYQDCDVQCPPPSPSPNCSTLPGWSQCIQGGCATTCQNRVTLTCQNGGECTSSSCTSDSAPFNQCGACVVQFQCY